LIFIYCAGSYASEIYDLITRLDFNSQTISYVDDSKKDLEKLSYKGRIYNFEELKDKWKPNDLITIANGNPHIKSKIYNRLIKCSIKPSNFIDKTSIVSQSAKYKQGLIVMPYCSISSFSNLSHNVTINYNSNIGHHTIIGDNTFISSMVNIGGNVEIGSQVFIGMGAQIKEGVSIGDNSIIAMGSVVHKSIPPGFIAMGNPARPFLKNDKKIIFNN
jgi:sugar O-acyltransferase (sialic acid O-acetyltransferase NeuD family)